MTSDPPPAPSVPGTAHDAGAAPAAAHTPSRLPAPARFAHPFSPSVLTLVFAGGILGALSRWALGTVIPAPDGWPLATLLINLAGALALGGLLESLARRGPDVGPRRLVRLTAGTGFLGAFTTYSTLAVEGSRLLIAGRAADGVWYLALSLLGGAAATLVGVAGAAWLHREDRRGLAAEAHVAAHPHGGGHARPTSEGHVLEVTSSDSQNVTPRRSAERQPGPDGISEDPR
ncbi:fluoride efflux transporter FluC [Sinomonas sp. P10A9]|uniref:Fluoride-specific ion channel FluC n=1 Tax=Sinomonas puerhi TaxID=3238584 RepID=A0AB39L3L0_9MICC